MPEIIYEILNLIEGVSGINNTFNYSDKDYEEYISKCDEIRSNLNKYDFHNPQVQELFKTRLTNSCMRFVKMKSGYGIFAFKSQIINQTKESDFLAAHWVSQVLDDVCSRSFQPEIKDIATEVRLKCLNYELSQIIVLTDEIVNPKPEILEIHQCNADLLQQDIINTYFDSERDSAMRILFAIDKFLDKGELTKEEFNIIDESVTIYYYMLLKEKNYIRNCHLNSIKGLNGTKELIDLENDFRNMIIATFGKDIYADLENEINTKKEELFQIYGDVQYAKPICDQLLLVKRHN